MQNYEKYLKMYYLCTIILFFIKHKTQTNEEKSTNSCGIMRLPLQSGR